MATATIKNTILVPDSWYAGPFIGWTTNKALATVYASEALADEVIVQYHMQAVTDTAGIEGTITFNASDVFVIPPGVTVLDRVQAWGAGGGGGGGDSTAVTGKSGGGGGGGAYAEELAVTVVSGANLVITVGTGGTGGTGGAGTDTYGGAGGISGIGDNTIVKADGGKGGYSGTGLGYGGDPGYAANCAGTISFNGGFGGQANMNSFLVPGAGGASGNPLGAGELGCGSDPGGGIAGGGSGGGITAGNGLPGVIPGGGGGGGKGVGAGGNGGDGADGLVLITLRTFT